MVVLKIYQLNKTDFDIDVLQRQLTPLQNYIKPNCVVGFYTNTNNSALFVEMQYIMAPQVISNKTTADTLLLIQFTGNKIKRFDGYRIIAQNGDHGKQVSLVTKTK